MTEEQLQELVRKAQQRYADMSPLERARHDLAQRRSYLIGMSPSSQPYEESVSRVDKHLATLPEHIILAEYDKLKKLYDDLKFRMDGLEK